MAGNTLRDYVWRDGEPVAQIEVVNGTDQVTYLHVDHLSTPRHGTNENGELVWSWDSDAFGASLPFGTRQVNLRFPGQYYDDETGLHYNYFRYYDPAIGRYLTSDPIGLQGGLNTYGYVGGNPVGLVDPLGLLGFEWNRNAGFGISGIIGRGHGVAGGLGVEMRQCCKDGIVHNEVYSVLRVGYGIGRGYTTTASGKGNVPTVVLAHPTGLPKCMQLDYWVGMPFGSGGFHVGKVTGRISTKKASLGLTVRGKGASAYVNIIDRRWKIMSSPTGLTCGCK